MRAWENAFLDVHVEWLEVLHDALERMDQHYLYDLMHTIDWLPGLQNVFAAFRSPLSQARYILFGESPYPRPASANGYAFWDADVTSLWSARGFSKEVNRATSLRNLMKMFLYARGSLLQDQSQEAIAKLDHTIYHQTAQNLFSGLINQGFILLNASLVYQSGKIPYHARMWRPFIDALLDKLVDHTPRLILLLFGRFAEKISQDDRFNCIIAEHPYNLSFITQAHVVSFFKPLDVLLDHDNKNQHR